MIDVFIFPELFSCFLRNRVGFPEQMRTQYTITNSASLGIIVSWDLCGRPRRWLWNDCAPSYNMNFNPCHTNYVYIEIKFFRFYINSPSYLSSHSIQNIRQLSMYIIQLLIGKLFSDRFEYKVKYKYGGMGV